MKNFEISKYFSIFAAKLETLLKLKMKLAIIGSRNCPQIDIMALK